jgi:hypothetical protein
MIVRRYWRHDDCVCARSDNGEVDVPALKLGEVEDKYDGSTSALSALHSSHHLPVQPVCDKRNGACRIYCVVPERNRCNQIYRKQIFISKQSRTRLPLL